VAAKAETPIALKAGLLFCDGACQGLRRPAGKAWVRILAFTSLFPNAVRPVQGIFVYQRLAHLARRPGNQVTVVAPVPYFPSWLKVARWHAMSQIPKQEKVGDLIVYHPRYFLLPKISMPLHGLLMFLGSLPGVLGLRKRPGFDCIDAHFVFPDGFAAVLLGSVLRIPVFVSARGTDINLYPSFPTIRPMIRWTLGRAAGVVAVSKALRDRMVVLGLPFDRIRVIANGVDTERFKPLDRHEARRRLGLGENGQLILSVGSLIPSKGHHLLIRALREIAPRYPRLMLRIIGEGTFRRELETLIREAGLQDRVQLVGTRPNEEIFLWFNAADISCLASEREGWPNVILESLACGTPVVATRAGGTPEILVSPDLGVLVDQGVRAIAAGIEFALNKEWNRAELVRYAQRRTWAVVAAEVEELLASRISGGHAIRQASQSRPGP